MAGPTEAQLKDAARKALAAGDSAAAKRLIEAARKAGAAQPAAPSREEAMAIMRERSQAAGGLAGAEARAAELDAQGTAAIRDSMGVGQKIVDNVVGTDDGVQSYGESLGTWLNRAGETATLGVVGDEASAAAYSMLPGRTYEGELDRFRENENNMSTGGKLSADIVGALVPALTGVGLASKGASLLGTMGRGAAIGGAQGATLGFMEGEGGLQNRADNAMSGGALGAALGGVVAPAAGALVDKGSQWLANRRAIAEAIKGAPTTEQLKATGRAAYKAVDDAGVVVKPEAFAEAAGGITADMVDSGMRTGVGRTLAPKSADFADVMFDMATDPNYAKGIPFSEIDTLRKVAGAPASDMANRLESSLGTKAIEGIDDFVNRLTPEQIAAGNADELPGLIQTARSAWSKALKSGMIDDAIENSQNYLSGEASGIRNQFARILKSPKLSRGFSELEKAAMRKVINGSMPERMLNLVSGGIGQLGAVSTGAGVGTMIGGAPGMVAGTLAGAGLAAGARKGAEAIANRNAEIVRALVASGRAGAMPQISQMPREIVEALTRRSAEVGRQ
jgi:hypothetical protein